MKVDRNMKLPDLILSTILLSKIDGCLKSFFRKKAQFRNSVTLKMRVALEFSLQLPTISHSGLILVLYARQIMVLSDCILAE